MLKYSADGNISSTSAPAPLRAAFRHTPPPFSTHTPLLSSVYTLTSVRRFPFERLPRYLLPFFRQRCETKNICYYTNTLINFRVTSVGGEIPSLKACLSRLLTNFGAGLFTLPRANNIRGNIFMAQLVTYRRSAGFPVAKRRYRCKSQNRYCVG